MIVTTISRIPAAASATRRGVVLSHRQLLMLLTLCLGGASRLDGTAAWHLPSPTTNVARNHGLSAATRTRPFTVVDRAHTTYAPVPPAHSLVTHQERTSTRVRFMGPIHHDLLQSAVSFLSDATSVTATLTHPNAISTTTLLVNDNAVTTMAPPEVGGISYSRASYYTVLGLYLLSFPGLWSTVKRSTQAKIKRKEFVVPGENAVAPTMAVPSTTLTTPTSTTAMSTSTTTPTSGQSLRQTAGEIMAYMKANNYDVTEAGETITFRGLVPRSVSQAFFLTFCTALGLLSLALVLQIQFQDLVLPGIGAPNWFLLALLSPYAGLYYWRAGDRVDECSVKLSSNEAETENYVTVQGSEEELERMWRTLGWQEKGMIKIDGLLDAR